MPEYQIALTFKGHYDDETDAFEHGDLVAQCAEHHWRDIAIEVKLAEVNP